MIYSVEITAAAYAAILAQARYIAVDQQSPSIVGKWLQTVWDTIHGLEQMPKRHNLAAENAFKPYEVRRALVGKYLILFTVDDEARKVWIIGFRHGRRLPRPDELEDPGQ